MLHNLFTSFIYFIKFFSLGMFKDHIKHLELYRMQQSKESLDILYNLSVQYQKSDFIVHLLCQAFPIGINEGEIYS